MNHVRSGLALLAMACLFGLFAVSAAMADPLPVDDCGDCALKKCKKAAAAVNRTVNGCSVGNGPNCVADACTPANSGYQSTQAGFCDTTATTIFNECNPTPVPAVSDLVTCYFQSFRCININNEPCSCEMKISQTDKVTVSVASVSGDLCPP